MVQRAGRAGSVSRDIAFREWRAAIIRLLDSDLASRVTDGMLYGALAMIPFLVGGRLVGLGYEWLAPEAGPESLGSIARQLWWALIRAAIIIGALAGAHVHPRLVDHPDLPSPRWIAPAIGLVFFAMVIADLIVDTFLFNARVAAHVV